MRKILLVLVFFGCNPTGEDSQKPIPVVQDLTNANPQILFSASDPYAMPSAAGVFLVDVKSKTVESISSGESSDASLFSVGKNTAVLFNRTGSQKNFRAIDVVAKKFTTEQVKYQSGAFGDPHDIVVLGDRALVANYSGHGISVLEWPSGNELQKISGHKLDLTNAAKTKTGKFYPDKIFVKKIDEKTSRVFVVHQALDFENNSMTANGSQQIFTFTWSDKKLSADDRNISAEGVQGIRIKGSFPIALANADVSKLSLWSVCSRYVDVDLRAGKTCVNSFEEFDTTTLQVKEIWDLKEWENKIFMNGPVIAGADEKLFYQSVEDKVGDVVTRKIIEVKPLDKAFKTVYIFNNNNFGYGPLFYIDSVKQLWTSNAQDLNSALKGRFVIIDTTGKQKNTNLDLALMPYSGVVF